MATEPSVSGSPRRPRTSLLVLLGVVVAVFLAARMWPGNPSAPRPQSSNPRAQRGAAAAEAPVDPAQLDVRLETLNRNGTEEATSARNPFRFAPPPPPPAPPADTRPVRPQPDVPAVPLGPPPPPPIPLKFIGIVEPKPGDKVAAFSDCRMTFYGRDGDVVAGQYRLVRIGVESVTMEYLDGRGRTTIRMSGQDCVNK